MDCPNNHHIAANNTIINTMHTNQSCQSGPDLQEPNSTHPTISSDILPEEGGQEVRIDREVWCKLAESEARLHLMTELLKYKVGFPDIEEFCRNLESKYRSTAMGNLKDNGVNSPEWAVVKACMNLKIIDERKTNSSLVSRRYDLRKKIEEESGKNTRKTRNKLKNLRFAAAARKKTMMKKNEAKLTNLKKKFRSNEEEKLDRIPEAIKDLPLDNLSIFDKQKYENIEVIEYLTQNPSNTTLLYFVN